MPAPITLATASPALSTSANEAITTCAISGFGSSFTVTSSVTASRPFGAGDEREQVVARRIERVGAQLERRRPRW